MTTSPKTLAQTITRTVCRNLLCGGLLVGSFLAVGHVLPGEMQMVPTETTAPTQAEVMIAANDCWTGDAPADMAGVLPGHVAITRDGDLTLGGTRLVSKALDQIFNGTDHDLTVVAFCR